MWFSKSTPSISAVEAAKKVGASNTTFIDVRTPEEYASGHAKGAQNYPLPTLSTHFNELANAGEVYVICQSGGRSSVAVSQLLAQNINAINIEGGTLAWRALGLPMA